VNANRRIPHFRHLLSMLVLSMLDAHRKIRRMISRTLLRAVLGALALGLLAMVFSSLFALRQVTRSVKSLVGDSMIGVESAVSMRSAVRETQLQLLRMQTRPDRRLPASEVDAFRKKMTELLASYRAGIYEAEDEANVRRIEQRLFDYLRTLQPIVAQPQPQASESEVADQAARELVDAVETAYQFNRIRIHASADEAGNAAERALAVSNRLWWSFGLFALLTLVIYFSYRWLALPEEGNG
jgi:hypothetical protein